MELAKEARDTAFNIVERSNSLKEQASKLSRSCNAILAMLEPLTVGEKTASSLGPQLQLLLDDLKAAKDAIIAQQDRGQQNRVNERAKDLQHRFNSMFPHVSRILEADAAAHQVSLPALEVLRKVGIEVQSDRERQALQYIIPDTIGKISDGTLIGEGGCSDVHEVWDSVRQDKVAVKVFRLWCSMGNNAGNDNKKQAFHQELLIMLEAELHKLPHVCKYYGFTVLPGSKDQTINRFGLVMKRYKGSLEGVLPEDGEEEDGGGLSLPQTLRYSAGILKGLVGLHSVPIVMNDLKPGNVLLDEDDEPHLADFGLSKKLPSYAQGYTTHQGRGTPAYMAPEKFGKIDKARDPSVTPQSDMWSFAATVVHMLTGKQPFQGMDYLQLVHYVGIVKQSPAVPANCDPQLQKLLQQCFAADPAQRPSAETALQVVEEILRQG